MSAVNSREIRLKSRPKAMPGPENFKFVDFPVSGPGNPYIRGRMRDEPSYVPPLQLGKPLAGSAFGEVMQSNDARYKPSDWVLSMFGRLKLLNASCDALQAIDAQVLTPQAYLGIAGITGLTA